MIFSKEPVVSGQGIIETLVAIGLAMIVCLFGLVIILRGLGTVILTKWASEYARCVAVSQNESACTSKITQTLQNDFAFKNVQMSSRISGGVIHAEIRARLMAHSLLSANYDLGPSEYKRVSR